jgi:hypothetical protein
MMQTINFSGFVDAFYNCNRGEQSSGEALQIIFDYLEEIDENHELDVVAVCCEFSEDTLENIAASYDIDLTDSEGEPLDENEQAEAVRDYLNDNTSLVGETNSGFVYVQF